MSKKKRSSWFWLGMVAIAAVVTTIVAAAVNKMLGQATGGEVGTTPDDGSAAAEDAVGEEEPEGDETIFGTFYDFGYWWANEVGDALDELQDWYEGETGEDGA